MQNKKTSFYNTYHTKNNSFFSIIGENNFTYFFHLRELRKIIFSLPSNAKILDIGCGVGALGFYLASKGFDVTGIDVSSRAISLANEYKKVSGLKNISFKLGDVQKIKIDKKFDLIICTEVIEHLEEDVGMIQTIYNLLSKSGFLLLSTPSIHAPLYKLGLLKQFDEEVGHLRRYDMNKLIKMLEKTKFKIIESQKNESILRNSLYAFSPLGFFIKFIKGPLVPFFHAIDHLLVSLFGESDLMIIARKP